MLVGAPGADTAGLAGYLTGQLDRAATRVALIDADPSQASIGPPGCLGLALTRPWRAPAALWFAEAGGRKEDGRAEPTVVGAARLAEQARAAGAESVVIDPPHDVGTLEGRELLARLAAAAGVDQVVALQRNGELGPLLELLAPQVAAVYRVRVENGRSPEPRDRRSGDALAARLAAHLARAERRHFPLAKLVAPAGTEIAAGVLVGALDDDGFCLGLGVIEEVEENALVLFTAVEPEAAARLRPSSLRARRVARSAADQPGAGWLLSDHPQPPGV